MRRFLSVVLGLVVLLAIPAISFAQGTRLIAPEAGNVVQSEPAQDLPAQSAPAGSTMIVAPDMPVPPPSSGMLPFGQSHFYTVTLRGNGEALVYLKTIFSNKDNTPLSSLKFTFPSTPQNLSVYQVTREPQCIRYRPMTLETKEQAVDSISFRKSEECLEYQEPDYQYGWGNTTYQKAQIVTEGNDVTVTLPNSIKLGSAGSLVLAYGDRGVTSKDLFGAYKFGFGTVKVNDTIQNMQVGVLTDPDYYLKDTKGTINYQAKETMTFAAAMPAADSRMSGNAQFDQFYNQIGQGTIVKNVSSLQPNESYSVKGVYADNRMKLYGKEISWGVGIVVVVLVLVFGGLFIGVKKAYAKSGDTTKKNVVALLPVLGLSFGSSILIFLYTLFLFGLSYFFGQMFPYYMNGYLYPLIMILFAVISLSIYSLLLFVPGILVGIKKNVFSGVLTIILTILWLVVSSIILLVLFFLFSRSNGDQPYPVIAPYAQPMTIQGTAPAADVMISK
jgi:hypothetical protein